MIKSNKCLILIYIAVLSFTNQISSQTVSLSDVLNEKFVSIDLMSDLNFILEKISYKEGNRNPYNFISETDFNLRVKEVKEYILANDSLSSIDFFKKVGPLLTSLKDDHSYLKLGNKRLYDKLGGSLSKENFVFPLSILSYDGCCFVAASDTLPVKSKIISINGIPILDIVKETLRNVNFSEYFAVKRNCIISFDFPKYAIEVWALFKFEDKARIKYVPCGSETEEEITIKLYPFFDKTMMKKLKIMAVKMDKNPSLTFNSDLAILRIPSFFAGKNNEEIGNGLKKWIEYFNKIFKEINSRNSKRLLIDIGNNGGGSEFVGFILLNYLSDRKIMTSFNREACTPEQLFNESIVPLLGDSLLSKTKFTLFKGDIYLLISEMTFSSAAKFADAFKINSIGKILGRETKGFRSHYGEGKSYDLEKTGLGLSLSSKLFISASGDIEPHGIIPDYEIKVKGVENLFGRFGSDYLLNEAIKNITN